MSRIIVKNLPKKVSTKKLENLFSSKGCITDLQLKYTKDGIFRQFAFVGYKTDEEAKAAKEYFHDTFVDASKIHVEVCAKLGDTTKPRAWSKYAKEKALPTENEETEISTKSSSEKKTKKKKKNKSKELEDEIGNYPEELKNDELFAEFLDVNKLRNSKPIWSDAPVDLKDNKDGDNEDGDEKSDDDQESENETPIAKKSNVSDMEYLRTKMESSNKGCKENTEIKGKGSELVPKSEKAFDDRFTVKVRNLPFRCKKKQIKQFFLPLKLESLRIPPKSKGFAYVKFKSEKDMKQAINKSKCILDGHKVDVIKYEKKQAEFSKKNSYQSEDQEKTGEELAETGRIFVRNLCFSVTEDELQTLFSKYGPISEIHVPIDAYTKKGLGFAFVAFLFPEHAIKAFSELDGSIFQGRNLHLIPAKPKQEVQEDVNNLSFKKKKEAKIKALSGSSHNWNTLFLGTNAVADVISKKYNVDKSDLLNEENEESIAVRMALGETQLVVETRKFLLDNGVQLDAFSQAASERSKTVLLAKNLPANTASHEIHDIFSKHGIVSKVVLPPSGITALIEFQESAEAKLAFKRLAYTRFHHMPLYLEWAPMNIFKEVNQEKSIDAEEKANVEKDGEGLTQQPENEIDDEEPEPGAVLFVKNLNFETAEESLQKHFKKCGPIHAVTISRKKDLHSGKMLSMGFGFLHFKQKASATRALQDFQHTTLDGHKLELKFSNKATLPQAESFRRKANVREQKTSKILVRNIPFEVKEREIRDLFKEFGMLKSVRLPKKPSGEGSHRGFGFVDFTTKSDAKRAFDALCHSTHLLGRRLVLEWANPDAEEVSELRKKTARDFYTEGPRTKLKKTKFMEDVMMAASNTKDDNMD